MSRAKLFDVLPDLMTGPPPRREARASGFEPLVAEAAGRPDFVPIDMSAPFTGATEPDPLQVLAGDADLGGVIDLDIDLDGPALEPLGQPADDPLSPFAGPMPGERDPVVPAAAPILPDLPDVPDRSGLTGLPEAAHAIPADGPPADAAAEAAHNDEIARLETVYQMALHDIVDTAIPKAREDITAAIAGELAPLVATRIRGSLADHMVSALVAEVSELLVDSDAVSFELKGPERLLLSFREQWADDNPPVRLVAADTVDIVAKVGRTVLATRLADVDRLLDGVAA
ncbi:hypothetical protein [Oricola sp.]|uniref:hypothetical protein n=1 Tax=Oricola sp. TaxID=1979950 RepID=UPI003BA8BB65